jgi:hypothetical protein
MPNKSEQDFKSLVESKKVIGTESSPLVLNRAELEGVNLSDVHFENVIFNDLALLQVRLDRAHFKNVTFNNCVSLKWRFDYATMDNVTFNKCKLRSFNPMGVTFVNTVFSRTSIDAASFAGAKGVIKVYDSDLEDLDIGDSDISWTITNSTLNKIEAFKIGGSITLRDSTFTDANLEFGEMDSFEAYNSTIDALGPGTLRDKLIVNGGKIQWTGIMNVPHADIADVKIDRLSLGYGHVGHVSIRNCGRVDTLGFSRTFFESISVSNCDVGYFGAFASRIKNLSFDNVAIDEMEAEEAQIGVWSATNVQLNGNLEFQHSKVSDTRFDRLTIGRKATLLNEGANFSFP